MANMIPSSVHLDFDPILRLFPQHIACPFSKIISSIWTELLEIRIGLGRPVMLCTRAGEYYLSPAGYSRAAHEALKVDAKDLATVLDAVTSSSVYAVNDCMREGFLPLPGGHRVGLVGEVKTEGNDVLGFRHVTGMNIRISHPLFGIGRPILKSLLRPQGTVWSTLIVAPPGAGKTTLLRDLIRTLSYGLMQMGLRPHRVCVADERGELAGGFRGTSQFDLGPRTDVLGLCPKRHALRMLLRSMGPEVLATDEIGHPDDAAAVMEAVSCGVVLLGSAHAGSIDELTTRPSLKTLWQEKVFGRIVLLSGRRGPGTVEHIVRGDLAS